MLVFRRDLEMKWFYWSDQAVVSYGTGFHKGATGKFCCFSAQTIECFDSSPSPRLGDFSRVLGAGLSPL